MSLYVILLDGINKHILSLSLRVDWAVDMKNSLLPWISGQAPLKNGGEDLNPFTENLTLRTVSLGLDELTHWALGAFNLILGR